MELSSSFLLYLSLSSLLPTPSPAQPATALPADTIHRTAKQQILATIPPGETSTPQPFLTSPSGKYTAYLLRRPTAAGAGGFGNDFCYVQVVDSETGESAWESECTPVSTSNTCSLVFSDNGLEVFDGSSSAWDTGAQSAGRNPLESLELLDEGDMRIRDKIGELAWKASNDPRRDQRCGEPGSPGLARAMPPFGKPIGGQADMPFGQQQQHGGGQGVAGGGSGSRPPEVGGLGEVFGFAGGRPLVDGTAYDSGCRRVSFGLASMMGLVGLIF
ncbi:hypothetical protein AXF42_Ash015291 [Apostasia shenzhenica]|uniref:Uncharacterized protein n=1 Tax=Apostasia shenzhenica TaxID=1088818 RepID=A0A2I0ALS1_9ASPA|nr:hypothetical protein AXF42_Ash015291 [Apostasia shenzhenica]